MADIYLGEAMVGLEPLPRIRWAGGGGPAFPHTYPKQAERNVMLDGATRYDIKSLHPRQWKLTWQMLTPAELARLRALHEVNGALYFQNNWEDATWRRVVISGFEYEPVVNIGPIACRYSASITLDEVV